MRPILTAIAAMLLLASCAAPTDDLDEPVEPLGDFQLGFAEVVAPNLEAMLVTETVEADTWIEAVDSAFEERFDRFDGNRCYHLGISVEAYSLPPALVPGRLALAVRLTVWDDAAQAKLNDETKLITVIRVLDGAIARAARTRDEKIRLLAEGAAKQAEDWMRERQREDDWFVPAEGADTTPVDCVTG